MTDLGLNFFPAAINDNGQILAQDTGEALLLNPTDHHGGRRGSGTGHGPGRSWVPARQHLHQDSTSPTLRLPGAGLNNPKSRPCG